MAMDLLARIKLGEDSILEFKEVKLKGDKVIAPHRDSLADEIGALANSEGGTIILGVADKTREIVGIPLNQLDIAEKWTQDIIFDLLKPSLKADLFKEMVEGNAILRVEIPKSLFIHKSPSGYFHRIGSSKREMSPEYLARLFQQRSQTRMIRFDETPVPRTSVKDLNPVLTSNLVGSTGDLYKYNSNLGQMNVELLAKLHLLESDEKDAQATVAGILMASLAPQNFLPNAYIQAICYSGLKRDTRDQMDVQDITGPLDQQIRDALHFVKRNMQTPARKVVAREDFPQYSLRAVFEAIVNAVAHRDYSIYGSKIRLHMFANRLEISSPGSLPNSMNIERMPFMQATRNEVISSLLARFIMRDSTIARGYVMDKRGEGVPIILSESEALSGKKPVYHLVGEELQLTIFAQVKPE